MKKQHGFTLIGTMLALSIFSIMLIAWTRIAVDQLEKRNAVEFKEHIELLTTQIQKYQYYQVTEKGIMPSASASFPLNLDGLMTEYPDRFWPSCSMTDERNKICKRPDGLPWSNLKIGYRLTFNGAPSLPSVVLTFPLSRRVLTANDRARWASELLRLPFAKNQANGDITITIHDPMIAHVYSEFIKRDGSRELTDTWDVGNQSILNAKQVSLKTQDGRQQLLGVGTVKEFLAQHGNHVYKNSFSCGAKMKKTIHVSVNAAMAPNSRMEYIGIASFKPYAIDQGSYWSLGLIYNAKIKATGKWKKMSSGFLNVRLNCSPN
ncbi:type II secretion system protein [Moritella viscosa]|uniref:Hypothetical type IV pilin PilA n=1 Tax=Moritella viscosa TaxID=80854 RepID=A0ABY1HL10_9GAMM|nr:type II secretion system protein [Moritella viscosa]SGZ04447.1 Hypothetical type IV pilin PilA [Moritella viscosa]